MTRYINGAFVHPATQQHTCNLLENAVPLPLKVFCSQISSQHADNDDTIETFVMGAKNKKRNNAALTPSGSMAAVLSANQNAINKQTDSCSSLPLSYEFVVLYTDSKSQMAVHPINTQARNDIVRKNPNLISAAIVQAQQNWASQEGSYHGDGCFVLWKPSLLPFHLVFEIVWSEAKCLHLVSVNNRNAKVPVSVKTPGFFLMAERIQINYAKGLIPLAKAFLKQIPVGLIA